MPNEVFAFRWHVRECDREWIRVKIGGREVLALTDHAEPGETWSAVYYDPLTKYPALHRTFAEIDAGDQGSILEFANQYGMLGIGQCTDDRPILSRKVETLAIWKSEIWDMRRAIDLWEKVRSSDITALSKLITWKNRICTYKHKSPWSADPDVMHFYPDDEPYDEDDVLMPTQSIYQRLANSKLAGNVGPELRFDPRTGKPVIQVIPRNLLGALWLQFVRGVEGDHHYRRCVCGTLFAQSPEEKGYRTSRKYCSDACKAKDYRARKAAGLTTKKGQ
jgi:hypothetical protein